MSTNVLTQTTTGAGTLWRGQTVRVHKLGHDLGTGVVDDHTEDGSIAWVVLGGAGGACLLRKAPAIQSSRRRRSANSPQLPAGTGASQAIAFLQDFLRLNQLPHSSLPRALPQTFELRLPGFCQRRVERPVSGRAQRRRRAPPAPLVFFITSCRPAGSDREVVQLHGVLPDFSFVSILPRTLVRAALLPAFHVDGDVAFELVRQGHGVASLFIRVRCMCRESCP